MLAACIIVSGSAAICAQDYPVKAIRVVTAAPGGGNDFAARVVAQALTARLGQPVVIENRGGTVAVPAQMIAQAQPDGHNLLFYGNPFWLLPLLRTSVPYDPLRDFAPIALTARSPNTVVVHPSLPVRTIRELIAVAKARPGDLNYATGQSGTTTHLAMELFKSMAGVNIVQVSYKGNAPALNDLIAGQVQVMFATAATVAPHVRSGRLRALAVTSAEPSPLAPGLPTVAASGLPGYESVSIYGWFAPVKTPAAIVRRLNQEIGQVLARADVKEKFLNSGVEAVASSPEELGATVKTDMARMAKVIKDAGIRED
jgi:tripartite-type tricarboxylate transporter receptor subunit TctC